jgi:glycosyltransferase involved in cell wall biosynthesis
LFYAEAVKTLSSLQPEHEWEFVFVDDGSKDKTLEVLRNLAARDTVVHYISFSRNFGKEAAILAGLQTARGAYAAILDADGQDPPGLIPRMLEAVESGGYDCAGAREFVGKPLYIPTSFHIYF